MGQVLYGSARTTEAVRRAIQHNQENLRALPPAVAALDAASCFFWLGVVGVHTKASAEEARWSGVNSITPGDVADAVAWYCAPDVYLLAAGYDHDSAIALCAAHGGTPWVGYPNDICRTDPDEAMLRTVPAGDAPAFTEAALAPSELVTPTSGRTLRRQMKRTNRLAAPIDALLASEPAGRQMPTTLSDSDVIREEERDCAIVAEDRTAPRGAQRA